MGPSEEICCLAELITQMGMLMAIRRPASIPSASVYQVLLQWALPRHHAVVVGCYLVSSSLQQQWRLAAAQLAVAAAVAKHGLLHIYDGHMVTSYNC